ncbi:MAG: dTMP kinase [Psittacicella sp.]
MERLIVLEGLDGSGKTTAVKKIKEFLLSKGIKEEDILIFREPGGTILGEKLRSIFKDPNINLDPLGELLILSASRNQLIFEKIKPAILVGKWVILDRFYWSTLAYQGARENISLDIIKNINSLVVGEFTPDIVLYLDIDPEIGLRRVKGYTQLDRVELSGLDFFKKARSIYLELTSSFKDAFKIDSSLDIERVYSQIEQALEEKYS